MPCKLCGTGKGRRRLVCAACTGKLKKVVEEDARIKLLDAVSEFRIPEYNSWNTKFFGTKYRPDFWWLLDGRVVVLEIDERGHAGYDKEAEARRECRLHSACPLPVTIVRFDELTEEAMRVLEAHLGSQ